MAWAWEQDMVDVLPRFPKVKPQRIVAGQQAARAAAKRWGGGRKGRRIKVTTEQVETVQRLRNEGRSVAGIARAVGLSRPTIYAIL